MKKVKNTLNKPSLQSRPWVIWNWNKVISKQALLSQLGSFIEKGFGGVAVRPSRDMTPPYLSEEFFDLFELVLSTAKQAGIGVRIADDFALPFNDFFEGLARYNREYRAKQIVLEHAEIIDGKATFDRGLDDCDSQIVLAARIKNDRIVASSVQPLNPAGKTGRITFKGNGVDSWQIMMFRKSYVTEPDGHYIPNPFSSAAAQAYTQEVLEKFRSRFSRYTPSTLEGFLTEMPAHLPAENALPWDEELLVKFRSKYRKDLVRLLPVLFLEGEDREAKKRAIVYSFMAQFMYDRFAGTLESYAKKHRLSQWVLAPERNVLRSNNALRDCLALAPASLSIVGVQNHEGTEESYPVVRAVADSNAIEFKRETVSVIGRNRLCAGSTLQSLKTEIDLHALGGPSRIVLDGCFFNLDHRSHVRTPFNPSWYYPGWDQVARLCAYSTRMSDMMKSVHLTRPAAIIMPSSSLMADYLPGNNESMRRGLALLQKTMAELQRLNIDFDIISEELFLSCSVRVNGEFSTADRTRKGRYQVAIMPYSRLISKAVFLQIEKLATKKGTVIFIAEPPQGNLDEGVTGAFTQRIDKLLKAKKQNVHVVAPKELPPLLRHVETSARVSVSGKRCPDIYAVHGSGPNFELYILHNTAERRDFSASVQLPAARHFYLAGCQDGELKEIKDVQKEGRLCTMGLTFAPRMTYLILASSSKVTTTPSTRQKGKSAQKSGIQPRNYRIVLKDQWAFSPDSLNVLPLANWSTRIGLSRESGGYSHYSESYFEVRELPEVCLLVLCGVPGPERFDEASGTIFEVAVNGNIVEPYCPPTPGLEPAEPLAEWSSFCGRQTVKYNIRPQLVTGFDRIAIRTVNLIGSPQTVIYPPLVAGTFSILRGARGWTIDKPSSIAGYDSWTKYGFPYLSGSGTYRQDFEVPSGNKRIVLKFTQTSGPVAVRLNGKEVGTFSWHPMEIDITSGCEQRRNTLEVRATNTLDNLLRMNGRPSGLTGEVFLDVY